MFCIFSDSTTIKAIHGGMVFEIGLLQKYGVDVVNYFDTMIAHWLVDENTKQGLKELMLIEYGKVRSKFKALPKDYPVKITAEYCMQDAENTLQLYHNLRPRLEAEKVDKWFYNVEMPLIKILLDMSKYGFPVDLKWLTEGVSKEIQTK